MEFVTNEVINKYINEQGTEGLPAVLLDGEIIMTGKYPTNEEFTKLLDLPEGLLKELDKEESGGCCCCGGDDNGSCC